MGMSVWLFFYSGLRTLFFIGDDAVFNPNPEHHFPARVEYFPPFRKILSHMGLFWEGGKYDSIKKNKF